FMDLSRKEGQFIRAIEVSPDGKWLAAGDTEGTMTLWNLESRKEIISKKIGTNDITDIAISPDSLEIATISFDTEVSIWSADKLESKSKFKVKTSGIKRIEYVNAQALVALGEKAIVCRTKDGSIDKELPTGRYCATAERSVDGKTLVTSKDDQLQLWNLHDLSPKAKIAGSFASTELVSFSPDGKALATANGSSLRMWDLENQRVSQVIDTSGSPIVGLEWLKESNLLMVATDFGQVRLWGTTAAGAKQNLKPLHQPIAAPGATQHIPALPVLMASIIDLQTFPRIPGSQVTLARGSNLSCLAPVKNEEAKLFYRYHLGKRGWMELAQNSANPYAIEFRKDGFMISASFYDAGEAGTNVNVNHGGNYDMRWVPKLEVASKEGSYESEHTVMYQSNASLLEIETNLMRKMHQAGWTAYSRLNASHNESVDRRDLTFIQNCVDLHVSIGKFPASPDFFTIQYAPFPATNSLPIPKDSGYVEFDGATEPYLVATTAMDLQGTRAFYDREMALQGWLPKKSGTSLKEDHAWLSYFQGQKDVIIGLVKQENGRTLVRVGKGLENSSWQLSKPKEENKASGGAVAAVVGLEA
ncbi:MAG: hypothetical protein ABL921_35065, partial [Pirellula sp.]